MKEKATKKQVIVFIDAANFEISLKQSGLYTVASVQWRTAKELKKQAARYIHLRDCVFAKKKAPLRGRSQQSFDC